MDESEDLNMIAAAIAAAIPFCRWEHTSIPCPTQNYVVLDYAATILTQHLQDKGVGLSIPALYALVDSAAHYLVAIWPKKKRQGSSNSIPILLAQVFFSSHETAPDIAHTAAVTLAAAAFATGFYPGGNQPSQDPSAREKRAAEVLSPDEEPTIVFSCSSFLQLGSDRSYANTELYIAALIALCHAKSHSLRDLCIHIIRRQPIPRDPLQRLKLTGSRNLLEQLSIALLETNSPVISFAVLHFGLLVANIISKANYPIPDRQSTLRRILQCHYAYAGLTPSISEHGPVNMNDLLRHLNGSDDEQLSPLDALLRTMAFAARFCAAGVEQNTDYSTSTESITENTAVGWHVKLQRLKDTT
ncbi:hypothetical protein FRC07_010783, partial [Ceratobasidium sp. 392]